MLRPYTFLMFSSPIILPVASESVFTCTLCRLFEIPYSLTRVFSDFALLALLLLSEPGLDRYFLLKGSSIIVPTNAHMRPTGRKVKKPSPSYPPFMSSSFITRLGGVPMSVIIPLMLLANAKGMSRRLGFIFALMAMLTTIGIIMATVPVLLTNAPMNDVTTITRMKRRVSLFPARRMSLELIIFASPVWKMAPPTTKSPTIMITDVLEKPEKASFGVGSRIPMMTSSASAHSATISERILPDMKKTMVNIKVASVPIASRFSVMNVCICT